MEAVTWTCPRQTSLVFLYLLAAVDAVQSLLQLSEGVALQTLGPFLWDGGQRLAQQALGGRVGLTLGLGLSAERSQQSRPLSQHCVSRQAHADI